MTADDQHLQDVHGPIITRGDLEAAEAEHAARCPGYEGADMDGPNVEARITANDAMAALIADAIQGGVTVAQLHADFEAQLSLHEDGAE